MNNTTGQGAGPYCFFGKAFVLLTSMGKGWRRFCNSVPDIRISAILPGGGALMEDPTKKVEFMSTQTTNKPKLH